MRVADRARVRGIAEATGLDLRFHSWTPRSRAARPGAGPATCAAAKASPSRSPPTSFDFIEGVYEPPEPDELHRRHPQPQ